MLIMLIGKVMGMFRNIQIAALYGTETVEARAYAAMSSIPRNFLDAAFASAISASFIPVFNKYLKIDKEKALRLADTFITFILIASLALTLLGVLFAPQLINLLYGFEDETFALAVPLLRVTLFTVVLSGIAFSAVGVLQSLGGFYAPAAMSIVSNGMIITYIWLLNDRFGIMGLAVVFVLGWFGQILIQIPPLIKRGYLFRFRFGFKGSGMREIGVLVLPVMLSTWLLPVNIQINQRVAETLADGGSAVINTAYDLYAVITGVFVLAVANVVFPKLSREADDPATFAKTLRETTSGMFFFLIPMAFGLFILSAPIVSLFFERGEFTAFSTIRTGYALRFYAIGIPGFGLFTILSRGFYASKNGMVPLFTAIAAITLNLVLSIVLTPIMGVGGPALASSVSINVTGLIMLFAMNRRIEGFITVESVLNIQKMAVAGILMAAAVQTAFIYTQGFGRVAALAVSVGAGIVVYFAAAFALRLPEMKSTAETVKRLLKRRRDNG
jgi:putative peptidoglycan lipid II flippase